MVLRKEVPKSGLVPAPLSHANPPYPTTPTSEYPPDPPPPSTTQVYSPDLNSSPAFNLKTLDDAQRKKDEDDVLSVYSDDDEWDRSDDEDMPPEDLPNPLKIGQGKSLPASANKDSIPDALKPGPPPGVAIKKPLAAISPEPTGSSASSWGGVSNSSAGSIPLQTNNPYLHIQNTGQNNFGAESSQQVWGDSSKGDAPAQAERYGELVELPSFQTPDTPTHQMKNLGLDDIGSKQRTKSIDQPPLIAVESATPLPTPQTAEPRHDSNASEAWDPGMDISSLDAWARSRGLPTEHNEEPTRRTWQEQQAWEQGERERHQKEMHAAQEAAIKAEQERYHEEEYNRTEQAAAIVSAASTPQEHLAPALPPRRPYDQEPQPPAMPPRPLETGVVGASQPHLDSPTTAINRQRKEHYQIKHIRWYDTNIREVRTSPILTQNINGPCPLLALVNALVLSTPASIRTEFVETLRTREQVSLGLLLDAVFEELMSGRRGGAAQELPDVNDLYKFLLGLQTGLNVNPMFVRDPEATAGALYTASAFSSQPGGFENTADMRLYSTFNVPLLHGWLPEPGSEAYIAFDRVAKTYETSQYIQFQEEELDAKLQAEGLNTDEQQMFTDIHAIKEFLSKWPTQLTEHGLGTMRDSLKPGQVAILFRNDHFSTLYKNPHTNELMTLVTDQGYSTHDEIVWESLVDVNGQGSELYSGDFRAIGNNSNPQRQQQPQQQVTPSLLDVSSRQDETIVQNRGLSNQNSSSNVVHGESPDTLALTEQEDHDLALALQLQEEEDDRHRRSVEERRRRENRLSEDVIAAHSRSQPGNRRTSRPGETPPIIPPRRNNVPPTHRPSNEPAPPPTYEEAATTPQYHPPQGHPANQNAPLRPQRAPLPNNAYQANAGYPSGGRRVSGRPIATQPPMGPGRAGRRPSQGVTGPNDSDERDKCVVM